MKQILIIIILISSGHVFAQKKAIEFISTEHDFGIIKEENGPVVHEFQFVNQGIDTILIQSVRASCGCTTPGWSNAGIHPGDTGFVRALYNPLNRPGIFDKTLKVTTNAEPEVHVLRIKGKVLPRPRSIAEDFPVKSGSIRMKFKSFHMGQMITKSPVTRSFTWINDGPRAIIFADSSRAPDYITIAFTPDTLQPQEQGEVRITYDPIAKKDFGFVTDRVKIFSNDSEAPIKTIDVVASIQEYFPPMTEKELRKSPRIEFLEKSHDFGHARKGKEIVSSFKFANTGKKDLAIRKVETNCRCVTLDSVPEKIAPGDEFTFNAHFDTTGRYGTQHKTITVFSNDPLNPINVLTIKGRLESD